MMNNLQQVLKDKGNGYCALIISPENRKYFTGFDSSDGFLLVSADRAVFITDGRYIEAAEKQISACEVMLLGKTYPQIATILNKMNCRHLLVESTRMTVSTYNSLKGVLKNISISTDTTLDTIINSLRSIKTRNEVESIIKAQRIAEKFKKRHETLLKLKNNNDVSEKSINILSRYVSILAVGEQKDLNDLMQYTIYQLYDEFQRYQLKVQWDAYIQARMAGAKDLDEVDNWMIDLKDQKKNKK